MPPFRIVDYIFPEVECSACLDFPSDNSAQDDPMVNIDATQAVKQDDENMHRLSLEIRFGGDDRTVPYRGRVKVVGIFEVRPDCPDKDEIVRINGGSLLYSAAREFVLSITSRGPNPPLLLPTIRFLPEDEEKVCENAE
jgi:preprotein translocase subunit SecB